MQKVLFIAPQPFFRWRGTPIRVRFDVQALAELGCEVDLLTLPFGEDLDIPGVRLVRAPNPFRIRDIPIGPSAAKALFDLILVRTATAMARRTAYDVVHGIEDGALVGLRVARRCGAKLVFEKHSDPASYRKGLVKSAVMSAYARVERFVARRADAVIGTGQGLVNQIRDAGITTAAYHIFDIPSSLVEASDEQIGRVRDRLLEGRNERLVTFVGSFAVYQGVPLMFQAIPRVVAEHDGARFVIIGGSTEQIQERRAEMEASGVGDRVTFVGMVPPDELPAYLAASDVLLSPRLGGINTPMKLLDYFKARTAIVATDTPANRLILSEANAVLTRPDATSFAAGICRALSDEELRGELATAGRRLVDETCNFAEFKRRLGECYADLKSQPAQRENHE